jgi:hypothetical protein
MEELIFGSVIVWALGRVLKKKADAPAPGTIDLPKQKRISQFPAPGSANYPSGNTNTNSGAPGRGLPGIL